MYMEETILPYIYIKPIANTMPQKKMNSDHPKRFRQLYVRTPMTAMSHPRRPSP